MALRETVVMEDIKLEFTEAHILSYSLNEKLKDLTVADTWEKKCNALNLRISNILLKRQFRECSSSFGDSQLSLISDVKRRTLSGLSAQTHEAFIRRTWN